MALQQKQDSGALAYMDHLHDQNLHPRVAERIFDTAYPGVRGSVTIDRQERLLNNWNRVVARGYLVTGATQTIRDAVVRRLQMGSQNRMTKAFNGVLDDQAVSALAVAKVPHGRVSEKDLFQPAMDINNLSLEELAAFVEVKGGETFKAQIPVFGVFHSGTVEKSRLDGLSKVAQIECTELGFHGEPTLRASADEPAIFTL